MRKHRAFFNNKQCDICKKPASIFRYMGNKCYVLCYRKKCNLKSRVREGFFDTKFDLGGK